MFSNRVFLTLLAGLLAIVALTCGTAYLVLRPAVMRVAVPSSDLLDQRVLGAAADLLRSQRASVRLETVVKDGAEAAAKALDLREVDLAVVRSDAALPSSAETVMILRREAVVLMAPKSSRIQKLGDLPGRTIGVARDVPVSGKLLDAVLEYYAIPRDKIRIVPLRLEDVGTAIKEKQVDAVAVVGPAASRLVADAVAAVAREARSQLQFIEVEEASAIAKRSPELESVELDQGAFGGRPPRPPESVATVGLSVRLVAHAKADEDAVAELTRQLLAIRQSLNAAVPGAGLIEAPDPDEASTLVIHPGVRIFLNGEQKTFLDRYGDWIYLALFIASAIGSATAGTMSRLTANRRRQTMTSILRIEEMIEALRSARTLDEVAALETQADEIFRMVLSKAAACDLHVADVAAIEMALAHARNRIAERRLALASDAGPPLPGRSDLAVVKG